MGTRVKIATEVKGTSVWISGTIVNPLMREHNSSEIPFLVDTGAVHTTLLQGAAKKLGIDFASLEKHPLDALGISGRQGVYVMKDTLLVFSDEQTGEPILRNVDMKVLKPDPNSGDESAFALLGTDLLSSFRFEYDLPAATLETDIWLAAQAPGRP